MDQRGVRIYGNMHGGMQQSGRRQTSKAKNDHIHCMSIKERRLAGDR